MSLTFKLHNWEFALSIAVVAPLGCSGTPSTNTCDAISVGGAGGSTACASGGAATGGAASTAGTTSTGGIFNTGGTVNVGGAQNSGGMPVTAGTVGTGGTLATGGGVSLGGTPPNGGAATGGADAGTGGASSPPCTNLCLRQVACDAGLTTTVSGTVYAPGHASDPAPPANGSADPLNGVSVYIPNSALSTFTSAVSCDPCSSPVSGSPLVLTTTGSDGKFVLGNVPVGSNIPLVIQLGRWRRQVTIQNVVACTDNPLSSDLTRLPRTHSEGDIPHIAIATGSVDAIECIFRKIGVADSEFTNPTAAGRIHIYTGSGSAGANVGTGTPSESQLMSNLASLEQYDMVLLPCQDARYSKTATLQNNLVNYANAGGRVFATHFSYVWLYNIAPFSTTANWQVDGTVPNDQIGTIDQSFAGGSALARWLINAGASTTLGQLPLMVLRNDVLSVFPPSQSWITISNPAVTVAYAFETPVGTSPNQQCGRVAFNDFHVEDTQNNSSTGKVFPSECTAGPMTPQEKLLEFLLFDLERCVGSKAASNSAAR